ncbi:hypothetical protein V8J88_15860 [Massilia sp. W12]|uniref:lysozyme inhibitor LprI family protein n=1 Tax=Massilia sp. W12 TaxID=3126507 RepID=UPI0030CC1D86
MKWHLCLPVAALAIGVAQAASFDCARAASPAEKMICAQPELSSQDESMARLWHALRAHAAAPDLMPRQQAWLKQRNQCKNQACLQMLYAQRIQAFQQLKRWLDAPHAHNIDLLLYAGEYATGAFFKDKQVQDGLRAILQNRYPAYQQFLRAAGGGMIEVRGDYLFADRSQLHSGGYTSKLFINLRDGTFCLFWLNDAAASGKAEFFGVEPAPEAVLQMVADDMNQEWGHVAVFSARQGKLHSKPK